MRKLEKIYVYNNNKLFLILVNNYENVPLIVYEKEIDRFRIQDIRKSSYLEGVKAKILKIEEEVNKNFANILKDSLPKLLLTTNFLELRREQFETTFDEACFINQEDIKRLIKKGINDAAIGEGYQVAEYKIQEYVLDDKVVDNIYGVEVQNIKLVVDIVIADNATVNELQSLFSSVGLVFERKFSIDYRLLERLKEEDVAIFDLNYETNKIFVKGSNQLYINYLNTGLGTILNKLYEYFKGEYGEKKAEEVTRFIKNNWIFDIVDYECDIMEEIDIRKIKEVTREIFLQYFQLVLSKFDKVKKFYIVSDDFFEKEFVRFLSLNFDIEIKQAFPNNLLISSTCDNKVFYCLNKIYKEEG